MVCYCYWKSNQYRNNCYPSIKLALIKRYHLHMCNRVLLWFEKLPQWNFHINGTSFEGSLRFQVCSQWNCHVNGATFQSGLGFQTGFSSLRISSKRALRSIRARSHETRSEIKPVWDLKVLWKAVPFTWQLHYGQLWDLKLLSKIVLFTWRFHCGNFPNQSKILMRMRKW